MTPGSGGVRRAPGAGVVNTRMRALLCIAVAQVLAMSVWFSAAAAAPALRIEWGISDAGVAWLTGAVQVGFVVGALVSALLNLADRMPPRLLIAASAVAAAVMNAAVPLWADGLSSGVPLRFLTGVFLAGIYPVGMKLMSTWFERGRGLALGVLVGALTLGSGSPHLIKAFGSAQWQPVLLISSVLALVSGIVILPVRAGPYASATPPLDLRWAITAFRDAPVRLANIGYLGHMWELYAMWAWLPVYLAAASGTGPGTDVIAFAAIGVAGMLGAVGAGALADRIGRTTVTITAMAVSGACAVMSAAVFGAPRLVILVFAVIWGLAVIADSAQFSVAVSELTDPRYVGTALTVQTAMGFLLTVLPIHLVGGLGDTLGWRWAFTVLAVGPAVGIVAMLRLRRHPAAIRLAGGKR